MVQDEGPVGLERVELAFDDERVVSDAGIALVATLAERLGIEALAAADTTAASARICGRENPGARAASTMTVYVVGSVNGDVSLPVEQLPSPGATVLAGDPFYAGGGKGANAAVAAVGDDEAGTQSVANLCDDGVDTAGVAVVGGRPTGLAMICVDAAGENFIVVAPGANSALSPELVVTGLRGLGPRDVCVVSFEVPDGAVAAAGLVAVQRGARLIVNPSPVRRLAPELLHADPVVVANAGELRRLTQEQDARRGAAALRALGCATIVVTLGADGAHVTTADGTEAAVAPYAAVPVDTTGAGDTFTGVFAGAVEGGSGVVDAAERAAAAAARSTERIGARAAMPATAEIDRVMEGVRPSRGRTPS